MTEIEAAIASEQLKKLERLVVPRIEAADFLTDRLRGLPGLAPARAPGVRHGYYVYGLRYDASATNVPRGLRRALRAEGVPVSEGYVEPIYWQPLYQQRVAIGADGWPLRGADSFLRARTLPGDGADAHARGDPDGPVPREPDAGRPRRRRRRVPEGERQLEPPAGRVCRVNGDVRLGSGSATGPASECGEPKCATEPEGGRVTNSQLDRWQGDFGNAYVDRNQVDWRTRLPAFEHMLSGLELRRVLEVGCNRGHNLVTVRNVLGPTAQLTGIEPNAHALRLARETGAATVVQGQITELPFEDHAFDLVFTAGVLIHIPPEDLAAALREVCRCSARYVLSIEYAAPTDTVVCYRGHNDLLWKRDFLAHYRAACGHLTLVREGTWGEADGFDPVNWWLLEKRGAE